LPARATLILAAVLWVSPASAQSPQELLDRYRPELRYDRSERSFVSSVDAMTSRYVADGAERDSNRLIDDTGKTIATANPRLSAPPLVTGVLGARYALAGRAKATPNDRLITLGRPVDRGRSLSPREVVYGRFATGGDGRRWIQYWLFFEDNAQDRGVVRTGRHAGDWEVLQLRLDAQNRPDRATFAQHSWAESCGRERLRLNGPAPLVFVAHASHAAYPRAGRVGRPFPDPTDEADGRGHSSRPRVEVISAASPRWVGWPGRWGESEAGPVPGEQSSPRGPAFQGTRWSDPSAFDRAARTCGSGAPGRPWQWPILLGLVALPILVVARRRHGRA